MMIKIVNKTTIREDYNKLISKYGINEETLKSDSQKDEYVKDRIVISCALRDLGYGYADIGNVIDRDRTSIYYYCKVNKIFNYYKK